MGTEPMDWLTGVLAVAVCLYVAVEVFIVVPSRDKHTAAMRDYLRVIEEEEEDHD